jgi:hypothetical protein
LYGDSTSVMGQVYRHTVYNCYNGLDYSYAGWMTEYTLDITPDELTSNNGTVVYTDLAFYGHYEYLNDTAIANNVTTPTLITVNGFYIIYNRKIGINAETNEYANSVLLHRYKEEGVIATGSDLVFALDLTAERRIYRNATYNVAVELCDRTDAVDDGANRTVADTVSLAFGTANAGTLCLWMSDMPSGVPSANPTVSSQPSVSPRPSLVPSDAPSGVPSRMPSAFSNLTVSSDSPSSTPSSLPTASAAPTISAAPSISRMPSNVPSVSAAPSISSIPTTFLAGNTTTNSTAETAAPTPSNTTRKLLLRRAGT